MRFRQVPVRQGTRVAARPTSIADVRDNTWLAVWRMICSSLDWLTRLA